MTFPYDHPETVYIAGPMRGLPEFNYPAFDATTTYLRGLGWKVYSPAEESRQKFGVQTGGLTGHEPDDHRANALRHDIGIIINPETTGIVLLEGWEYSEGACTEYAVARVLGLKIMRFHGGEVVDLTKWTDTLPKLTVYH